MPKAYAMQISLIIPVILLSIVPEKKRAAEREIKCVSSERADVEVDVVMGDRIRHFFLT